MRSNNVRSFNVSQKQVDEIKVGQNEYQAQHVGGEVTIELQKNVDYTVVIPADATWITENKNAKTRGLEKASVVLTIAPNNSGSYRSASLIRIKDDDKHTATDASQENAGKNTKFVEKTVIDYSSVNEISTTKYDVSTNRSVRPVVDVNGRAVMWQYGYYNSSSYNSFNMDARFSKLSQND